MFSPPPTGQTPEQQKETEDAAKKQAEEAEKKELDKRKDRLKKEGNNIYGFAGQLASKIPPPNQGMSRQDFGNWVEGFEQGWVDRTTDPADTPYEQRKSERPRVRIINENANL